MSRVLRAVCLGGVLLLAACGGGGGDGSGGDGSGGDGSGGDGSGGDGSGGDGSGGGGSGGGPPATPPPVTARAFEDHSEYCGGTVAEGCAHWALRSVGAAAAYARIANQEGSSAGSVRPGRGVRIAVIDTRLRTEHREFEGASIHDAGNSDASTRFSHGTAVVSVIVANRGPNSQPSESNFHGIAWGADLKMVTVGLGVTSNSPYVELPIGQAENLERSIDRAWLRAALNDPEVDIVNMSFAYRGLAENYDSEAVKRRFAEEILIRAQADRDPADRVLLVHAAGNDNDDLCNTGLRCESDGTLDAASPFLGAALAVFFPELRGHTVAVAATDRNGRIADLSNRCGIAAKWCLAAPGEDILFAYSGPCDPPNEDLLCNSYSRLSGTSFAAPSVAGGLAVLMHYFGNSMGNDEILTRLKETATRTPEPVAQGGQCPEHLDTDGDRSDCELSAELGWGLMNLDAATRPVGMTSLALGDRLAGRRLPAASSRLQGGQAFGDALAAGLRGRQVVVFDEGDAPFRVGLDRFVASAGAPDVARRLAGFLEPADRLHLQGDSRVAIRPGAAGGLVEFPFADTRLRVGLHRASWGDGGPERPGGHASLIPFSRGGASATLIRGPFEVSAFATSPAFANRRRSPARTAGARLAWNPGGGPLGFRLGAIHEFGSSLGMEASGAFGRLTSGAAFVGVGLRRSIGGWEWAADAELGYADPASSPELVEGVSDLSMSAFSVSGTRVLADGGRIRLSAGQTLRVESGRLRLDVPVARDKQHNVLREAVETSLVPSGRQIDLAAEWRRPVAVGEFRLGAVLSLEPGHAADRDPEFTAMAGYRLSF